jgi:hypothetical protein
MKAALRLQVDCTNKLRAVFDGSGFDPGEVAQQVRLRGKAGGSNGPVQTNLNCLRMTRRSL